MNLRRQSTVWDIELLFNKLPHDSQEFGMRVARIINKGVDPNGHTYMQLRPEIAIELAAEHPKPTDFIKAALDEIGFT